MLRPESLSPTSPALGSGRPVLLEAGAGTRGPACPAPCPRPPRGRSPHAEPQPFAPSSRAPAASDPRLPGRRAEGGCKLSAPLREPTPKVGGPSQPLGPVLRGWARIPTARAGASRVSDCRAGRGRSHPKPETCWNRPANQPWSRPGPATGFTVSEDPSHKEPWS